MLWKLTVEDCHSVRLVPIESVAIDLSAEDLDNFLQQEPADAVTRIPICGKAEYKSKFRRRQKNLPTKISYSPNHLLALISKYTGYSHTWPC